MMAGPSRSAAPPLPAPRASTSSSSAAPSPARSAVASIGLSGGMHAADLSPPTPAPSPQPSLRNYRLDQGETSERSCRLKPYPLSGVTPEPASPFFDPTSLPTTSSSSSRSRGRGNAPPSPLSEPEVASQLRAQVNALSRRAREQLLQDLLRDTAPIDLSPLYHLIVPRLQRDFLRTLPLELALHVLSFVDDARTLARASAVSRHWHALLLDESTWRRMCWKSGFAAPEQAATASTSAAGLGPLAAPPPARDADLESSSRDRTAFASRLRTLEFGERAPNRDDALFTPAGRERRGTLDREALEEIAARTGGYSGAFLDLGSVFGGSTENPAPTSSAASAAAADIGNAMNYESSAAETGIEDTTTGLGFGVSAVDAEGAARASMAARHARGSVEVDLNGLTSPGLVPNRGDLRDMEVDGAPVSPMPDAIQFGSIPPGPALTPTDARPQGGPRAERNGDHAGLFDPSSAQTFATPPVKSTSSAWEGTVQPFSYRSHFKLAYLSEQNWIRGPGTLLSTQMSVDQGVVTSMAFDNEWIVVGMDTSKVHIFESGLGTYVRTLAGHELGVWCLTLVSKGGGPRRDDATTFDESRDSDDELGARFEGDAGKGKQRARSREPGTPANHSFFRPDATPLASSSYSSPSSPAGGVPRPSARRRRRSFASLDAPHGGSTSPAPGRSGRHEGARPSTCGGMGLGAGGPTGDSTQQGGVCGTARGWGQDTAMVVSGGSDRNVRVWDVATGRCLHVLPGHTSTVRCLRVLDGRPIAVSGSRDGSIRVWDIQHGRALRLLSGHRKSVRAIEVCGNRIVSGSYDTTARLWDVDTGECLQVFRGHIGEIYSVAFDGSRVITGSLDSTVRVWDAETGDFLALLQGHTLLVGQMQLDPYSNLLVTAGSDGTVMVYSLATYEPLHRIKAHSQSVTSLQFDERFILSGGNDGRLKLWDTKTGAYLRDLSDPCDTVWRALVRDDKLVSLSRRDDRILMDVKTFREPAPAPAPDA